MSAWVHYMHAHGSLLKLPTDVLISNEMTCTSADRVTPFVSSEENHRNLVAQRQPQPNQCCFTGKFQEVLISRFSSASASGPFLWFAGVYDECNAIQVVLYSLLFRFEPFSFRHLAFYVLLCLAKRLQNENDTSARKCGVNLDKLALTVGINGSV